jgi:hypothetical protein
MLSIPGWWLFFYAVKAALLRSKNPEWFNLYSTNKLLFIIVAVIFSSSYFYLIRKIIIQPKYLRYWDKISEKFITVFIFTSLLSCIPFLGMGIFVGEDIGGQVKTSLDWISGNVKFPNFLIQPNSDDLSCNQQTWSLRPPGASLLAIPGMCIGFSLGKSIQFTLLGCSIIGGYGWLAIFRKLGINNATLLIVALILGTMTVYNFSNYSTANIILYSAVPWFILFTLKLGSLVNLHSLNSKTLTVLSIFLFLLGSFAWIKLSGIIVGGTIGACLLLIRLVKCPPNKRLTNIIRFGVLGLLFWIPLLFLEQVNLQLSGKTADQLYNQAVSDVEAPLTGKHWLHSTRSNWLIWSLTAAPGYALPAKNFAHAVRDFGKQFSKVGKWLDHKKINNHVIFAGLFSIFLTVLLLKEIRNTFSLLNQQFKIIFICFLILPFLGLAILSYRFEWNYLLYHSHTIEFWLILIIPTLIVLSSKIKMGLSSFILGGVVMALPICNNIDYTINAVTNWDFKYISKTEKERGLSSSRFSKAIDCIENNSNNPLDILFFLPSGDMGDLVLRSKLRTLATHFSGDNFPNSGLFKTSKKLNIYCAYDSSLHDNHKFIESFDSKFPQKISQEIIHSEIITVLKITLSPNTSIEQPS